MSTNESGWPQVISADKGYHHTVYHCSDVTGLPDFMGLQPTEVPHETTHCFF